MKAEVLRGSVYLSWHLPDEIYLRDFIENDTVYKIYVLIIAVHLHRACTYVSLLKFYNFPYANACSDDVFATAIGNKHKQYC